MRSQLLKSFLIALLMFSGTAVLTGCNTFRGMGEDVEATGEEVQEEAEEHEPDDD